MQRQRGATVIGMIIILAIVGFALYGAIRLVPLYLEYMAVARAMEQTAKDSDGATSVQELRNSLERRWAIEDIKSIDPRDIEIKRVSGGQFTMQASYRAEAPFIGNVSLVVDFDKVVDVR